MIFDELDPSAALTHFLGDQLSPSEKNPDGGGVQFRPGQLKDFPALFTFLSGQAIEAYLPAAFTQVADSLLITSLPAIQEEDENRGLSLITPEKGVYRLEFAVVWTTPWIIEDVIEIQDSFIAFIITFSQESGLDLSAVIGSGQIKFFDYHLDLDVSVHVPSFLIEARLKTDQDTTGATPAGLAENYLGSLKKAGADAIFVEDVRLSAAPFLKSYLLHLSVHNVLDLHDKFRVDRFQAEISYRGGGAADYAILAYANLDIGFARNPVSITLAAALAKEGDVQRWSFAGSIAHPVAVSEIMEDLASLFGASNPYHLPDFVADTALAHLGLAFEVVSGATSQQDYLFTLGLSLPVEERTVPLELYAHYRKTGAAYELELTGALSLDGFQLGVAFAKSADGHGKSDTLVLGSLQTPLKLDSADLIHAIAPSLADDVPFDVDIELLGLLLAMHSGSGQAQLAGPGGPAAQQPAPATAQREYLFRLSFNLDVGLGGLPLIGQMLEGVRFKDGQLLAASRDWQNQQIGEVNGLLGLFEPSPAAIAAPQQPNATVGVGKGIALSGAFQITQDLGFPLFLQFGGAGQQPQLPQPAGDTPTAQAEAAPVSPGRSVQAQSDQRSQSKIDQVIGAVRIKKVALIFENGRIGIKITGGLALAAFEFELMGMQVTVPQSVLDDPAKLAEIAFALDGFGVDIHQGTLAIMGAFLRQHYEEPDQQGKLIAYDEFSGIVQVAFPPLNLTGMGSYAMYDGHPSLFLFVALGYPIPLHPSLLIEGMALGFGIHRDFIPPLPQDVLTYPLVAVAITPPPPIDIAQMALAMHKYFPPAADLYFVVVGVKFKAFGIVDSLIMAAVKFGRSLEINLIGVSSILFPTAFIELVWTARFVPESGYLFIGGQLTERSYLLAPQVQISGGFAISAWMAGEHKGDFVVSVGGYHPHFHVPDHYPNHIPRLGISFKLGPADIKAGMYFAITPQCVMMGGFLEINVTQGSVSAFIKLALDAIIYFQPFHYDLLISADIGVKVDVPLALTTLHIDMHLHADLHIWGPDFSGTASLDVGPKTFDVAIGAAADAQALPISYQAFKEKFLPRVCTVSVTQGLLRKAEENGVEIYVVDAQKIVIEARTTVPITAGDDARLGITPMDVKGKGFHTASTLIGADRFRSADIEETLPAGLWGGAGLQTPDLSDPASGLLRNVHTGYRLTPDAERVVPETHAIEKEKLSYNTDLLTLKDREVSFEMVGYGVAVVQERPIESYFQFTGLHDSDVSLIDASRLRQSQLLTYALS